MLLRPDFETRCILRPQIIPAVLALVLLFTTVDSAVAEWRIEPTLGIGYEYDDNAQLSSDSTLEQSIDGFTYLAAARFSHQSQLSEFWIEPSIEGQRFGDANGTSFDSNDSFLSLYYDRQGQRSQFRVRGSYDNQTIRTAERSNVDFDVEDPEEIPDDDSGIAVATSDRQLFRLAPNWTYRSGRRTLLRLGLAFTDASYDEIDVGDPLRDYTTMQYRAALGFNWSERDTVSLTGYHRRNDYDDNLVQDSTGAGLGLRYDRKISERTRLVVDLSADRTEDANGEDQTNPVGGISIIRRTETGRLLASYRRSVSGGGSGVVSVRDFVNVDGIRDITERFSAGLGVRAYTTDAIEQDSTGFNERDYLQFRAFLRYRATQELSVEFDYHYTDQENDSLVADGDSNRFNIWFKYSPIL